MSIAANFPKIRPTLLLDFANSKRLDPRITFTRGGTARHYDGKTFSKAEENMLTYSQEFDNGVWVKENCSVIANSIAAPDGTTTADTFTESTGTALTRLNNSVAVVTSGQPYSFSVHLKNGDRGYVQLVLPSGQFGLNVWANFDLINGVLGTVGSSTTASMVALGNGWYRCTISGSATASGNAAVSIISITSATDARSFNVTGSGKTFYLWGAQLEQRSRATAYTPTTTQPITNYIPQLLTAASGVARFEHNPTTGESLGLEIEEQRTNLLTYSEDLTADVWIKAAAAANANLAVAPDGTQTADKIVESSTNAVHFVNQTPTITAGTTYTFSGLFKAAERSVVQLGFDDGSANGVFATFNLSAGTISGAVAARGTGSAVGAAITSQGNGWYRCSITGTAGSSATVSRASVIVSTGATTWAPSYAGDGYSGLYIWGAQLEAGAFPTSYIKSMPVFTSRASTATYFDANRTLQTAAINVARYGNASGGQNVDTTDLLLEGQRTNSIRNNTMVGAVAGTPGTTPTNWTVSTGAGITRELVGVGTENGIAYIDYRFSGTGSVNSDTQFEFANVIAALSGQTWTHSCYFKVVGGSLANITLTQILSEYTSAGGVLAASTQNITPGSGNISAQRFSLTRLLNNASTAYTIASIRVTSTGAIDLTLRIGLPQLELGSTATSPILTSGSAVTRSADVFTSAATTRAADDAVMTGTNFTSWFRRDEGTIYVEGVTQSNAVTNRYMVGISDSSFNNFIGVRDSAAGAFQGLSVVGGTTQANLTTGTVTVGANQKLALSYATNSFAFSANGSVAVTGASGLVPLVDRMTIGNLAGTTQPLNGTLKKLAVYPLRLSTQPLTT